MTNVPRNQKGDADMSRKPAEGARSTRSGATALSLAISAPHEDSKLVITARSRQIEWRTLQALIMGYLRYLGKCFTANRYGLVAELEKTVAGTRHLDFKGTGG